MRLDKTADGARIRLNLAESHVLEQLFTELDEVLEPDSLPPGDPVRERLYPAGYSDAEAGEAFRDLTESGLFAERSERVEQCLAEVRAARGLRGGTLTLDADGVDRWLRVLNDLRLSVGTRIGITEDDDNTLDESDPLVHLRARYLWLTALQDALVTTVLG